MFEYLPGIYEYENNEELSDEREENASAREAEERSDTSPAMLRLILGIIILIGVMLAGIYSPESGKRIKEETKKFSQNETEADRYADTLAEWIISAAKVRDTDD